MSQDKSKQEKLQDALGLLDDDLLLEVEKLRQRPQKRRPVWGRLAAIAAGLCVLVGAGVAGRFLNLGGKPENTEYLTADGTEAAAEGAAEDGAWNEETEETEETTTEENVEGNFESSESRNEDTAIGGSLPAATGVSIAPMAVDLRDRSDIAADMVNLFIYQGRCYVEYMVLEDASQLIGEYLGTATGLIDEWTEEDGYVDFAGTTNGDFYAVNGFDSDFVLCQVRENDSIVIYMNDNDLTLYTGADLLKQRFKVDGGFTASSISQPRWRASGVPYAVEGEAGEQIELLVEAMMDAPFVYAEEVALPREALYHLYLQLENGLLVHLRLYHGGYIQLQGMDSVCIQVEPTIFSQTIQQLKALEDSLCGVPVMEEE